MKYGQQQPTHYFNLFCLKISKHFIENTLGTVSVFQNIICKISPNILPLKKINSHFFYLRCQFSHFKHLFQNPQLCILGSFYKHQFCCQFLYPLLLHKKREAEKKSFWLLAIDIYFSRGSAVQLRSICSKVFLLGPRLKRKNYSATALLEMADVQDDMPKHTNTLKALLMLHLLTSHWTKESQGRTQMQLVVNALQPQSSGKRSYRFSILVSVPSGCYSRKPQTRGLRNNRTLFLVVLETGKFRARHQQICCPVRAHFLVHRQPSFCCILTWQMG